MNLFDNIEKSREFYIANTQGYIFLAASEKKYDLEKFVTEYMHTDFCKEQMDVPCSYYQSASEYLCLDLIEEEFKHKDIIIPINEEKAHKFFAHYAGFVYRYLALLSRMSSEEIIDKIPYNKLLEDYSFDYYDSINAIKEICKREGIYI